MRVSTLNETHYTETPNASVKVVAEPLDHFFDEVLLARPVADAILQKCQQDIRDISELGPDGHRLFNRTGELTDGMNVIPAEEGWAIAAPPDRLKDQKTLDRLFEVVPSLLDPLNDPMVETVIEKTTDMLMKARR